MILISILIICSYLCLKQSQNENAISTIDTELKSAEHVYAEIIYDEINNHIQCDHFD